MWKEFFKFDLGYQLKQPLLWVFAAILAMATIHIIWFASYP